MSSVHRICACDTPYEVSTRAGASGEPRDPTHDEMEDYRGDGRRFEFERWFDCAGGRWLDCVGGRSVGEAEPNHPRHQPNAAAQSKSRTRAPTSASFSARRKTLRATNRKSTTTTKTISPVEIAVNICFWVRALRSRSPRTCAPYFLR
jgi:hypothetical protein